jgi:hypothetical protein
LSPQLVIINADAQWKVCWELKVPEIQTGMRVQMRKPHPCGSDEWVIYRIGADIGLRCVGCGRRVMLPRSIFTRRLKRVVGQEANFESGGQPEEGQQS